LSFVVAGSVVDAGAVADCYSVVVDDDTELLSSTKSKMQGLIENITGFFLKW